jgi:hypothetical protein
MFFAVKYEYSFLGQKESKDSLHTVLTTYELLKLDIKNTPQLSPWIPAPYPKLLFGEYPESLGTSRYKY